MKAKIRESVEAVNAIRTEDMESLWLEAVNATRAELGLRPGPRSCKRTIQNYHKVSGIISLVVDSTTKVPFEAKKDF